MTNYRLYHYWRSSSSWRVRWGLVLKGIAPEYVHVDLLNGESESEAHRKRNPFGYVPALEILDGKSAQGKLLTESVAILEYLDETVPTAPLLPKDPFARARVRALVETINAGTQPIQNLNVMLHLAPDDDPDAVVKRKAWCQHWIRNGLSAYEALAKPIAGKFSFEDSPTLADLCLIPQCYNAARFDVSLDTYPTIARIHENALKTEAYRQSEPDRFKPSSS
jgi:maleylacetoacetate isomerase